MQSIFGRNAQTVNITDCDRGVCPGVNSLAARLMSSIAQALPTGQLPASLNVLGALTYRGVNPVGFADNQNNTLTVIQAIPSFAQAAALFTREDASDFGTYVSLADTSSASAWKAVSLDLDRDYTVSGAPSGSRMRPIGYFVAFTVPESVGKIQVTDDFATATKYSSYNVPVGSCLQFIYFIPFRDYATVYGGNAARPGDATTLFYSVPPPGVGGILAPGAGTAKTPGYRVFDLSGNQIAASVQVETWFMNYTPRTNAYVLVNGSPVTAPLPELIIENFANVNL